MPHAHTHTLFEQELTIPNLCVSIDNNAECFYSILRAKKEEKDAEKVCMSISYRPFKLLIFIINWMITFARLTDTKYISQKTGALFFVPLLFLYFHYCS